MPVESRSESCVFDEGGLGQGYVKQPRILEPGEFIRSSHTLVTLHSMFQSFDHDDPFNPSLRVSTFRSFGPAPSPASVFLRQTQAARNAFSSLY